MGCTNKVLLQSTAENYIQYPMINHIGKEYKNEYMWDFLAVRGLRLHTSTEVDTSSNTGQGTNPTYTAEQ